MDTVFGNTFFKQNCFDGVHEWRWTAQQVLSSLVSDFIVLENLIDFPFIEKAALIGKERHQTEIREPVLQRLELIGKPILLLTFQTPDQHHSVWEL